MFLSLFYTDQRCFTFNIRVVRRFERVFALRRDGTQRVPRTAPLCRRFRHADVECVALLSRLMDGGVYSVREAFAPLRNVGCSLPFPPTSPLCFFVPTPVSPLMLGLAAEPLRLPFNRRGAFLGATQRQPGLGFHRPHLGQFLVGLVPGHRRRLLRGIIRATDLSVDARASISQIGQFGVDIVNPPFGVGAVLLGRVEFLLQAFDGCFRGANAFFEVRCHGGELSVRGAGSPQGVSPFLHRSLCPGNGPSEFPRLCRVVG